MPVVERIWKVGGKRPLSPSTIAATASEQGWPIEWWGKANSVHCPRGRAWGEANFIVSQETLDGLSLGAAIDITCKHESGTTTWAGYYCIRTQAISKHKDKSAHWITLADRRWLLERVACNKRFNLRKDDTEWVTTSINAGTPWTWQEILDELWALLPGVAGTAPTLPAAPGSTPENFVFDGMSAWRCICQVLTAIGCAVAFDPLEETFSYVDLNDTQAGLAALKTTNEKRRLWKFNPHELTATNYPEKVIVTFHKIPGTDTVDDPFPIKPETEEVSLGEGGLAGTSYPIVDTLFARDANAALRTARAEEIKDALIGLLKPMASPWGMVYAGVIEFVIGSELTSILWSSDGSTGMTTTAKFSAVEIDWPELILGDAGGSGIIEYTITSLSTATSGDYDGLVIAAVVVRVADDTSLIGETINVVDHSGCIFDEASMAGWTGWGAWGAAWSLDAEADCETLTPKHWYAVNRCCDANTGTYADECA